MHSVIHSFITTTYLPSIDKMNNLVYALLVVPMLLIISTAIFTNFSANVDQAGWSTEANDTKTKVEAQTWSGFKLGSLLPYVLIAVTIITVLLGAFGLSRVFG